MPTPSRREPIFNVSARKVGGLWFLKLGRLTISWSVSRQIVPVPAYIEVQRPTYPRR